MARKIKISASVLNIRLHPHDEDIYLRWIALLFKTKGIAKLHGDRHGMISMLDRSRFSQGIASGIITTFLKIDDVENWFNAAELKEATVDQVSEVSIPENLYPSPHTFYFRFNAKNHKLYFQTYSKGRTFTPASALRLFGSLSRDLAVQAEFGEARISIVQDKANITRLFSIPRIKELNITILKPNADVFDDDFEENIEKHLEETHSSQMTITYKSEAGKSIVADDDIRKISSVALNNGSIKVIGRDETGAVNLNSEDFPEQLQDRFDPDAQTEQSAFYALIAARTHTGG